jgi:two-component system OmpR family response regulator
MRILLVEDEADLLTALAQSLRESGYAVDEASEGQTALVKALGTEYDAIVLDLMLPRTSGLHLLRELRKKRATPVLILTARGSAPDRVAGLDAGADDYMTKPFDLSELHARLRALIRRSAGQASPAIEVGDVLVDTAKRVVTKDGEMVALTPREYSLVELFTLNKGRLVSRTMIYEHLFEEDDDTLSNIVDVHVANVRKKLGRELIMTRRGEGYQVHV